ncbi:unnamed protein product, partial [Arabidopsis halleri]
KIDVVKSRCRRAASERLRNGGSSILVSERERYGIVGCVKKFLKDTTYGTKLQS